MQGAAASGHLGYDPFFLGASASMATVATAQGGIRLRLLGEPKLDLGTDAFPLERKDAAPSKPNRTPNPAKRTK